jgi:hypothetical protein
MSSRIILLRTLFVFMAAVVAFLSALDNQSCDLSSWVTAGRLPRHCNTNGRNRVMSVELIATVRNDTPYYMVRILTRRTIRNDACGE